MTVITAIFCAECDRRAPLDEWMPMMYRVPITHGREVVAYVALCGVVQSEHDASSTTPTVHDTTLQLIPAVRHAPAAPTAHQRLALAADTQTHPRARRLPMPAASAGLHDGRRHGRPSRRPQPRRQRRRQQPAGSVRIVQQPEERQRARRAGLATGGSVRVRIENDGQPSALTKITTETGERIHGVTAVDIHIDVHDDFPRVTLHMIDGAVALNANADVVLHALESARPPRRRWWWPTPGGGSKS